MHTKKPAGSENLDLMLPPQPISDLLRRLWSHLSVRRRRHFFLLLLLMLASSASEILSIGSVLPFLSVLTIPERAFAHPVLQPFFKVLGLRNPAEILVPITVAFGIATLIACALRLTLLWASARISFATGADLGINIYRRTLYQPYVIHCARNSSEVISVIAEKSNDVVYRIILPAMTLVSSSMIFLAIFMVAIFLEPIITMTAFGGFGLIYLIIIKISRKRQISDSFCVARGSVQVLKTLQEGLGGIRDVLIDGSQAVYCKIYSDADRPMRLAQGRNVFIASSPRYAMEALGMLLIIFLAYTLSQQDGGIGKAIPILGGLALGAQRLLPLMQHAYGSWATIQSGRGSLRDTLELLDQPMPDIAGKDSIRPIIFKQNICLKNVGYSYGLQLPIILTGIDLSIKKGSRVGFVGITGSGKSTLLDIVMGLLQPTVGELTVDGQVITAQKNRAWQAHIAHVPQNIFLSDSTIEENIGFGIPREKIDKKRVILAAMQAQIHTDIENWPQKYKTLVGERGIRLSGGQRQRVGIARALYKEADVIVLDEATSALDDETELAVMQAIEGVSESVTVLIIAHRLSTLKNCTQVVELRNGSISRIGSYEEIMA